MRLFGYARYSSKKQDEGFSIEAQVDAIKDWARQRGHVIEAFYIDRARSGFKNLERRTAFQEMWGVLLESEDVGGIVVHVSNRFSRNEEEDIALKAMLRRAGKVLLSVTEPWLGGESPTERLTDGIMRSFNQYQSLLIGWESKKGTLTMARRGLWPRVPPMGYKRAAHKMLEPDKPYSDWVAQAFEEYSSGRWTLTAWTREAERRGIHQRNSRPVHRSHWGKIFCNLIYTGDIPWKGEVYPGLHQAIITRDVFEAVREVIDSRRTTTRGAVQRHFYLLRGLVWSAVHKTGMHGNTARGRNRVFRYYRATGRGGEHNAPCQMVEDGVEQLLSLIRSTDEVKTDNPFVEGMLRFAPHAGAVYSYFNDDEARRGFLQLIFLRQGVGVTAQGSVFVRGLQPGFKLTGGEQCSLA